MLVVELRVIICFVDALATEMSHEDTNLIRADAMWRRDGTKKNNVRA